MSATATPPRGSGKLGSSAPRRTASSGGRRREIPLGRIARGTLSALWILARVVVIVACLGIVIAWRGFDVTPLGIVSGSMAPTVPTNSLIFVERVSPSSIREGDVITFDPPGETPRVTHRVVTRKQVDGNWYFETKGDANKNVDDWRTLEGTAAERQSRGVTYLGEDALRMVWDVPEAGRIVQLTEHTTLRKVLVFGSLAGILVLLLVRIWRDGSSRDEDAAEGTSARKVEAL